jgi:hypothetical protein
MKVMHDATLLQQYSYRTKKEDKKERLFYLLQSFIFLAYFDFGLFSK